MDLRPLVVFLSCIGIAFAEVSTPDPIFPFPLNQLENYEAWKIEESVFTPEECEAIKKMGLSLGLEDAKIGGDNHGTVEDADTRISKISWITPTPENQWVFQRLMEVAKKHNDQHYQFDLVGFFESMQFTQYEAPGSHYSWHVDGGSQNLSNRKLSLVVQLTDPKEYEGGGLEVFDSGAIAVPKGHGAVTIFPAYLPHRVLPVTKGVRHSLVAWISGPPFR